MWNKMGPEKGLEYMEEAVFKLNFFVRLTAT